MRGAGCCGLAGCWDARRAPPLICGWLQRDFVADGSALPVLKEAKIGAGLFLKAVKQAVHGKLVIIVVFLGGLQYKNIKCCTVQG